MLKSKSRSFADAKLTLQKYACERKMLLVSNDLILFFRFLPYSTTLPMSSEPTSFTWIGKATLQEPMHPNLQQCKEILRPMEIPPLPNTAQDCVTILSYDNENQSLK